MATFSLSLAVVLTACFSIPIVYGQGAQLEIVKFEEDRTVNLTIRFNQSATEVQTDDYCVIEVRTRLSDGGVEYEGRVVRWNDTCTVTYLKSVRCVTNMGPVELYMKINNSHVETEWTWTWKDINSGKLKTNQWKKKLSGIHFFNSDTTLIEFITAEMMFAASTVNLFLVVSLLGYAVAVIGTASLLYYAFLKWKKVNLRENNQPLEHPFPESSEVQEGPQTSTSIDDKELDETLVKPENMDYTVTATKSLDPPMEEGDPEDPVVEESNTDESETIQSKQVSADSEGDSTKHYEEALTRNEPGDYDFEESKQISSKNFDAELKDMTCCNDAVREEKKPELEPVLADKMEPSEAPDTSLEYLSKISERRSADSSNRVTSLTWNFTPTWDQITHSFSQRMNPRIRFSGFEESLHMPWKSWDKVLTDTSSSDDAISEEENPDPDDEWSDKVLRLPVLMGKTGAGKSSTGNTILGEELFHTSTGFSSETTECQTHGGDVEKLKDEVTDSPGMFDTNITDPRVARSDRNTVHQRQRSREECAYTQVPLLSY